jgi:excisionase family DNA binding protein
MSTTAMEELLKPDEVWRALRISRATFFRLVASGELPAVKIGKQLRVSPTELERWIYRNEQ